MTTFEEGGLLVASRGGKGDFGCRRPKLSRPGGLVRGFKA
jgi:hypothetical protein